MLKTVVLIVLLCLGLVEYSLATTNKEYLNFYPSSNCFNDTKQHMGYTVMLSNDGTVCLVNENEDISYLFTPYDNNSTYIMNTYDYQTCSNTLLSSDKITLNTCVNIPSSTENSFLFTTSTTPLITSESVLLYNNNCNKNIITYYSNNFYDDQSSQKYFCQKLHNKEPFTPYYYACEEGECEDHPISCGGCYQFL
ncbi:hypothetical protein DLAC_06653 [Tieghemostelium lacteum]|uniref:Uncharacterized protein n=1 Tax=Tieghemostelium lacteum TaxID=361077 RepID=A0A151ZFH1_TIELA|nr:hypothetical protein DLAC_06653 [Tieghemostelium lacteum]|eukprot:KYQ92659.1 hypothetical protein DLAC_06653 [Tieghemostelium lacteum]